MKSNAEQARLLAIKAESDLELARLGLANNSAAEKLLKALPAGLPGAERSTGGTHSSVGIRR